MERLHLKRVIFSSIVAAGITWGADILLTQSTPETPPPPDPTRVPATLIVATPTARISERVVVTPQGIGIDFTKPTPVTIYKK